MAGEVTARYMVNAATGLHAREACKLVETFRDLDCDVTISDGNRTVDEKSILNILTLGRIDLLARDILAAVRQAAFMGCMR